MRNIIVGLLLMLMSAVGWGAGNDQYGNSVMQLVAKTNETADTTYLSISLKRCAAMLNLVNGILLRDTGSAPFPEATESLLVVAMSLDTRKAQERGATQETKDGIPARVSEEYARHRNKYLEWMTFNYDQHGDYWGTDLVMGEELDSCKALVNAIGE